MRESMSFNYAAARTFIEDYDQMYGTLYITKSINTSKNVYYLEERYYPTVEVEWSVKAGPLTEEEANSLIALYSPKVRWHWSLEETKKKEPQSPFSWDAPLTEEQKVVVDWMLMKEKDKQAIVRRLLEKGVVKIGDKLQLYVDTDHPAIKPSKLL